MVGDLALLRPAVVFSASTMAAGVLVTFLPLAIAGRSGHGGHGRAVRPATGGIHRGALGGQAGAGDRRRTSARELLCPGVVLSAAGVAALAVTSSPGLVIGGAAVFGTGFGLLQNATLTLMYARVPATGQDAVSADLERRVRRGHGRGRDRHGPARRVHGYPAVFLLTAALAATAVLPAWRERARQAAGGRGTTYDPGPGPGLCPATRRGRPGIRSPPGDGGFRVPRGERRLPFGRAENELIRAGRDPGRGFPRPPVTGHGRRLTGDGGRDEGSSHAAVDQRGSRRGRGVPAARAARRGRHGTGLHGVHARQTASRGVEEVVVLSSAKIRFSGPGSARKSRPPGGSTACTPRRCSTPIPLPRCRGW